MRGILDGSILISIAKTFIGAYQYSWLKSFSGKLSIYASESLIGKAYAAFVNKKPRMENSLYQKVADKIGGFLSVYAKAANGLLVRLVSGSLFMRAVKGFYENKTENKVRAVCLFGFYFCIAAMLAILLSGFLGGGASALSGRMTIVYVAALALFAAALFVKKLSAAVKNSFLTRVILDLLK